jgi:uncharacterized RDD family membrane protein YckC
VQSIDRLNIETPEQITLELPLAGIGSRFLALALDSLIQMVALLALLIGMAMFGSAFNTFTFLNQISTTAGEILAILVPFCIYWGYFAFFEILWRGQSPGKRAAGIRVIKQTGRPMTAIEAIGRNLMRAVDFLPGMYGVGLICMMCNQQNKRLGDFVAGTVVVHDKAIDTVNPGWAPAGTAAVGAPEMQKLAADDLVLLETYLSRRYDLDMTVREDTARQIAAMVQQKAGMPKTPGQSDDDFLETVARQLRDSAGFR